MNRTTLGTISGTVATVELSAVNLWLGMFAAFLTIICLIPTAIKNWHELLINYRAHKNETGSSGFFAFVDYLLVRRLQRIAAKADTAKVVGSDAERAN